ncbi:UNVERIFIED_CONTAM: hypothetical protein NCL1_45018 [Trichonephila clavipes]
MGEEYRPSRKRIFLTRNRSSCAEKHFHSEASLEAVDRHDRTTRKTGCGRKVTLACDDQHLLRMAIHQFVDVCCTMDCVQGCFYTGSLSRKTIDGCVCIGLMSTEPSNMIGTKLSFQMNHASICETMMAAFMLDAIPVNDVF